MKQNVKATDNKPIVNQNKSNDSSKNTNQTNNNTITVNSNATVNVNPPAKPLTINNKK